MQIHKASRQWKERPADERFWSIEEMQQAMLDQANNSQTHVVRYGNLRLQAKDDDLFFMASGVEPAKATHFSLGQAAIKVGAPANYVRKLPAELAALNINYGLSEQRKPEDTASLLLYKKDNLSVARCLTSEKYERIWNHEIGKSLQELTTRGWRIPPARPSGVIGERVRVATQEDCVRGGKLGLSINIGDKVAPAGVYAGDRDMFVFMIDDDHVINNPLTNVPLARGFFCWNSEVGDKTFGIMTFLYEAICGNHIVWGAQDVKEFRVRHIGVARSRAFSQLGIQLMEYANESVSDEEAIIKRAQAYEIASSKDKVVEELLSIVRMKKLLSLNKDNISEAYNVADSTPRYGNPRSLWGMVQGLTEVSQNSSYTDKRVQIDREASKLLQLVE